MAHSPQRVSIRITGLVQGVGFRPYVYRLATESELAGWVVNTPEGVGIEAEGEPVRLQSFLARLPAELPPLARIDTLHTEPLPPEGESGFRVRLSRAAGPASVCAPPDVATCPACLAELSDPANRRYRYPFISCTDCGPRWSITAGLPFDRERTAMKIFPLCPACRAEYENPADRRFHAQTQCCPDCGPALSLRDGGGVLTLRDEALRLAAQALRSGAIVALQGIGGFQLMADAGNEAAVLRLRHRKSRPAKPFAVMIESTDAARTLCEISDLEQGLLDSAAAPIVLLRRLGDSEAIAPGVAPDNPWLGVMRAYSPLHHLLLAEFGGPVVCTSGNRSGEPICVSEDEARVRLADIADLFLVHDRPVLRALDDSVARVVAGQEMLLRRARGYEPIVRLGRTLPPVLAVGGHLKNTVALAAGDRAVLSQHLGDLDSAEARENFRKTVLDLEALFGVAPDRVAADLHPDYASTRLAEAAGKPLIRVQHHHAHALSCMAEHGLEPPLLGIAWDGVGFGPDGTLWGGEFLRIEAGGHARIARFRPFPLPGGEKAVREPRRAALGLLYESFGATAFERTDLAPVAAFSPAELKTLAQMLDRGINAPLSSGVGRLFDGVAALLGLRQATSFEGEAAMALEFAAERGGTGNAYPFDLVEAEGDAWGLRWLVDWTPIIPALLEDAAAGRIVDAAAKFHRTLAEIAAAVAAQAGLRQVVLTGGTFQNRLLTEMAVARLETAGFTVHRHRLIPSNDGGLALGQLWAAGFEAPETSQGHRALSFWSPLPLGEG
jgi:hydrogenase maturation protein HypF